jgi:hypothetical protein
MKTTINAINTWKYYYLIFGLLFGLALVVFMVCIDKTNEAFLVLLVLCILMEVLVFGLLGAFLTTRVQLSKEGFVQTCWFGLKRYEAKWEECFGYGFLFVKMQVYMSPFLFFSNEWRKNKIGLDGSNDFEYARYEPGHYSRPRVGIDFCQLEYTPMMYCILREYLPENMRNELDQQTGDYQDALPYISPYEKARAFFGIGRHKKEGK